MLAIGKMNRAYLLLYTDLLFHYVKFWWSTIIKDL